MGLWETLRRLWAGTDQDSVPDLIEGRPVSHRQNPSLFPVLITAVEGDPSGRVVAELREAVGGSSGLSVTLSEEVLGPGDDQQASAFTFGAAVTRGRTLLQRSGCQVLIWAEMLGPKTCRVRFIPRQMKSERSSGELLSGDMIDLPVPMGTSSDLVLGGVLAALHLDREQDRKNRFERLRGSINAMDLVLQDSGRAWPAGGKTKAGLLYAGVISEVGFSSGQRPLLQQALELYRKALGPDMGQALLPPMRAAAQVHFGDVLSELGNQDENQAFLSDAIAAYRLAAAYYTIDTVPEEHANLMNQLGRALQRLSRLTNRTGQMKEAAEAYLSAAQVWTAGGHPDRWAELQFRVGTLLGQIVEFSGNTDVAEKAVAFYTATTGVWSREKDPRRWANVMNNIGAVRFAQGKRNGEAPMLREAVECFSRALEVYKETGMTKNVHVTQKNIARVERVITTQQGGD